MSPLDHLVSKIKGALTQRQTLLDARSFLSFNAEQDKQWGILNRLLKAESDACVLLAREDSKPDTLAWAFNLSYWYGHVGAINTIGSCMERISNDVDIHPSELDEQDAQMLYYHALNALLQDQVDEGWHSLKRAAAQGYSDALALVGVVYLDESLEAIYDPAKASDYLTKAADQGHRYAQYYLGTLYYYGKGVPIIKVKAKGFFEAAAAQGCINSCYKLGGLYYHGGTEIEPDHVRAAAHYLRAALHGYADAQHVMGILLRHGDGVAPDLVKAVDWYTKAALNGNQLAQYQLGLLHCNGTGVPCNHVTAMRYFSAAADQGHSDAQFELGRLFCKGLGTTRNLDMARMYWKMAADQGHARAQYRFGASWLCLNQETDSHIQHAMNYLRLAAEQDHEKAISKLYEYASGTPEATYHLAMLERSSDQLVCVLADNPDLVDPMLEFELQHHLDSSLIFSIWGAAIDELKDEKHSLSASLSVSYYYQSLCEFIFTYYGDTVLDIETNWVSYVTEMNLALLQCDKQYIQDVLHQLMAYTARRIRLNEPCTHQIHQEHARCLTHILRHAVALNCSLDSGVLTQSALVLLRAKYPDMDPKSVLPAITQTKTMQLIAFLNKNTGASLEELRHFLGMTVCVVHEEPSQILKRTRDQDDLLNTNHSKKQRDTAFFSMPTPAVEDAVVLSTLSLN